MLGLQARIEQTQEYTEKQWNIGDMDYELFPRMITIIPVRGYTDDTSLSGYDPRIKELKSKTEKEKGQAKVIKAKYHIDMETFPDKDYSNPLFYIEDEDRDSGTVRGAPPISAVLKRSHEYDMLAHMSEVLQFN